MNLLQLKTVCCAYHGKKPEDLIEGPVDLFLVAANNARKSLEEENDFEQARCTAVLDIDGVSGGALKDAIITPDGVFSGIRSVVDISGLRNGTDFVPLDFTRADIAIERDRYELELSDNFWPTNRYPSDAQILNTVGGASLVLRGGSIYNFPRLTTTTETPLRVYIEAYGWLKDYVQADLNSESVPPQDFILEAGFEYLQWTIIIELNYLYHTFVPRQEGNVGSPERLQKEALRRLIQSDAYAVDPYSTRSR